MKNSTLLFGLAALLSVTNALSQTLAERQVITQIMISRRLLF